MFRKTIALVALALAVGVAGPGGARGEVGLQWKHQGAPLTADATVKLAGEASFTSELGLGSSGCVVHGEATLSKGTSTGSLTKFEFTTGSNGKGSGLLGECVITKTDTTNLPYHLTGTAGGVIDITGSIEFDLKYASGCIVSQTKLVFSKLTATTNGNPIKTVTLGGTGETTEEEVGPHLAGGVLSLEPSATYSLE